MTATYTSVSEWFNGDLLAQFGWAIQIVITLLLTIMISVFLQFLLRKLSERTEKRGGWRRMFIASALAPLKVGIWLGGISIIIDLMYEQFRIPLLRTFLRFQPTFHVVIFGWFLLRFKNRAFSLLERQKAAVVNRSSLDLMEKVTSALLVIGGILLILPTFGISISGILAFGGVGGAIVAFASKDVLSNIFGAAMIHIDRPFNIGDWVIIPEKNIEGNIEQIGWRQVAIRNGEKRLVFVPNSLLTSLILDNASRMTHRRINETIGIRYEDVEKLPAILADIREYLGNHPDIDQVPGVLVNFIHYGAYSVDLQINVYSPQISYPPFLQLKEEVLFKIGHIIKQHQAEIAFPTQIMHLEK